MLDDDRFTAPDWGITSSISLMESSSNGMGWIQLALRQHLTSEIDTHPPVRLDFFRLAHLLDPHEKDRMIEQESSDFRILRG